MPAMDIFESEDGDELIVKIDLPGFEKKDIQLSIDEDILSIRAKREPGEELRTGSIYYEHRPRQIDKKIVLPISPQDGQKVTGAAVYTDGVITVRIPSIQAKNIQIL
jgi:HSP20 family protein